ncbi:hypothetical protein [Streptomyces sp. NPDC002520]
MVAPLSRGTTAGPAKLSLGFTAEDFIGGGDRLIDTLADWGPTTRSATASTSSTPSAPTTWRWRDAFTTCWHRLGALATPA